MHIFAPKNMYINNNALVFVSFDVSFGADLFAAGRQASGDHWQNCMQHSRFLRRGSTVNAGRAARRAENKNQREDFCLAARPKNKSVHAAGEFRCVCASAAFISLSPMLSISRLQTLGR
jgi:hypothetical protein